MIKKVALVAMLLLAGIGWLVAQSLNTLPPAKQAIEAQYAQERVAGAQNPAPKNPDAPYPVATEVPFQTGIFDDGDAPFSSQKAIMVNRWQGLENGIETIAYAGAESENFDPQQGIVYLMSIPDYPAETSVRTILSPVRAGALRIVDAKNDLLKLVSATGSYVLTLDASSGTFTSVVVDTTPPVISGMPGPQCMLWPPNQKLVQVASVTVSDDTGVAPGTFKVSATSNQPISSTDPMYPDIVITPNTSGGYTVQLRADRLGNIGTDRIYTLTATATDFVGNVASSSATCTVPHDQRN